MKMLVWISKINQNNFNPIYSNYINYAYSEQKSAYRKKTAEQIYQKTNQHRCSTSAIRPASLKKKRHQRKLWQKRSTKDNF